MRNTLAMLILAATLGGCSSSSVLVGKARPPIAPEAVRIYLTPPAKYEEVALLTSSSETSFAITDQGKMNAVMKGLREEAAKHGANGVLIRETGDKNTQGITAVPSANGGFLATSYAVQNKAATGIAIYVPEPN
jgi:hypothetical protein